MKRPLILNNASNIGKINVKHANNMDHSTFNDHEASERDSSHLFPESQVLGIVERLDRPHDDDLKEDSTTQVIYYSQKPSISRPH